MAQIKSVRERMLSQVLYKGGTDVITVADYEDLLIEKRKLERKVKQHEKELEEYRLYDDNYELA